MIDLQTYVISSNVYSAVCAQNTCDECMVGLHLDCGANSGKGQNHNWYSLKIFSSLHKILSTNA